MLENTIRKPAAAEIVSFPNDGLTIRQIDNRVKKLIDLEEDAKRIKKEIDAIKAEIKNAMNGADEIHTGKYVIKNTSYPRTTIDSAKVKDLFPVTDYPEIYKVSNQSRFTYKEA